MDFANKFRSDCTVNKCKDCGKFFRDAHALCPLAEMDVVNSNSDACASFIPATKEEAYCPSATNGDYSPSNPWDAPGMCIRDFI